jgi:hypothetical protein
VPRHNSPAGNDDVLDIVVHKNIRLLEVTVSEILDSDHLSIVFHLLELSDPVYRFTEGERFQSPTSKFISPRIEINSGEEVDKAVRDYTASIASAYRLSTSKITLSDLKRDLPALENLLKQQRSLRKLWQVTQDPACKTAVNWVAETIRRMTCRKAPERWETKVWNCKITPQVLWPIAKSLMKRDGPKAPIAVHGLQE